ncbi:MAG: ATP-binding protein [Candidatus Obscuribacterales bacterium]|nr:ATP-binding protein [Candidatus Obscuribacterales bacterium]
MKFNIEIMESCAIISIMIPRRLTPTIINRLEQFPAVALLGPRQVGKTTLAHTIAKDRKSIYLDLEIATDRAKLLNAESYLSAHEDKLVILDEVQRAPELFQTLRGLIDQGIRDGRGLGRFLLLGSVSVDLLKQSGESLAGRIAYEELFPLDVLEINASRDPLWLRGGFPKSFISKDDHASTIWRDNFIRTYLERDIPQLGPRIPAETLRRFWTMLSHNQGNLLNAAQLARNLSVDGKTIARYLDLMVDLLLVRRLIPFHANARKRLVKSPKVYVRDSGLVHALLGIENMERLAGHPVIGASWEGFVIENLLSVLPWSIKSFFYRSFTGAEIDLVLELSDGECWAIEIKRSLSAKLEKGFYSACEDLKPTRAFVVYSGSERYPIGDGIEAIGLEELTALLAGL